MRALLTLRRDRSPPGFGDAKSPVILQGNRYEAEAPVKLWDEIEQERPNATTRMRAPKERIKGGKNLDLMRRQA
jgi:hypothetical protein